jgi:protein TonB
MSGTGATSFSCPARPDAPPQGGWRSLARLSAALLGGAGITFVLLLALPLPAMQTPPERPPEQVTTLSMNTDAPWTRLPRRTSPPQEEYDLPAPPALQPPTPPDRAEPLLTVDSAMALPQSASPAEIARNVRLDTTLSLPTTASAAAGPATPSPAFELGAVDNAPRVLRRVAPRYPETARRQGRTGTVLLRFVVETDGSVSSVQVLESDPVGVFDTSAVRAVQQWTFSPGQRQGRSVRTWVQLPVRFRLE